MSGTQYYFDNLAVFHFCYSVQWARFLEWILFLSIIIIDFVNFIVYFMFSECANKTSALGMANGTITDSDITSSSVLNSSYAKFARLGRGKAWIPTNTDGHSWIQVNLQRLINITGLATQGLVFKDKNAFIRSYYLSHGDINGTNWMNYTIQGKTKVSLSNHIIRLLLFFKPRVIFSEQCF